MVKSRFNELDKIMFVGWVDKSLDQSLTNKIVKLVLEGEKYDLSTLKLWKTKHHQQRFMHQGIQMVVNKVNIIIHQMTKLTTII